MAKNYGISEENPSTSVGRIFLIGMIKNSLVMARLEKDYQKRFDLMVEYFFELASLVDETKKKFILKDDPKFKTDLDRHKDYYNRCKQALSRISHVNRQGSGVLQSKDLDIFDEWLYELKRLEQKCGIGIKGEIGMEDVMGE